MRSLSKEQIEAEAIEWSVKLSSGDADRAMLNEFKAWREQSPNHESTFQRIDCIWLGLANLQHLKNHATLPVRQRVNSSESMLASGSWWDRLRNFRWSSQPLAATAFVLVCTIGALLYPTIEPLWHAQFGIAYRSAHQEIRAVSLQDGSTLTLAPNSRVRVKFQDTQRHITLTRGHALFEVAHDAQRPFIVLTEGTQTQVLGTTFSVVKRPSIITVAVKTGKVQVGALQPMTSDRHKHKLIVAGQAIDASFSGEVDQVRTINADTIGAWKEGRLIYNNAPLSNVIADANRYSDDNIVISSPRLEAMTLSISFSTDKIDTLLNHLKQVLPLEVKRNWLGQVVLTERE